MEMSTIIMKIISYNNGFLQGFEELLRMGIWDFSFVISGSDLPLRDIDDMAAMLAPHRG